MNFRRRLTWWMPLLCALLFGLAVGGTSDSRGYAAPPSRVGQASPAATPGIGVTGLAAILAVPPEAETENKAESRELIYKTINFIILVGGLAFVLRQPLSAFFASRSSEIREGLDEGRKALAASQARMKAIEDKLQHLEEEIAAFKAAATREMEAERERMRLATEAEAEKMLESARSRMDTATRAAKLDLRFYIAGEALKQAEQIVRSRLDDPTRQRLVSQFVARLDVLQNRN